MDSQLEKGRPTFSSFFSCALDKVEKTASGLPFFNLKFTSISRPVGGLNHSSIGKLDINLANL